MLASRISRSRPHGVTILCILLAYCMGVIAVDLTGRGAANGSVGAVASDSSLCSSIGIDMLKKGGNAADSMVATVLCNGVVGMYMSGIGGGGFMLIRVSNGSYDYVDFREEAPKAASENMYRDDPSSSMFGGLASGVPGELRGLEYLHKTYGRLDWRTLVQPSINISRDGFPVTDDLVHYMEQAGDFLTSDPAWAQDFAPNGTRLGVGDTMTRKRLAATLEVIAAQGADAFYTGPIANATINALRASNGIMTLDDLKGYTIMRRKPANITYRGYQITSCSAPASGAIALSVLKTLEGYGSLFNPGEVNLSTHRLDEAMRFGYGNRAQLGDPTFILSVQNYEDSIRTDQYAQGMRNRIMDNRTFDPSYYDPAGLKVQDTPGTSYYATADSSGLAISLTSTVNLLFGSRLMVPETGVIMNDQMDDFSIPNSTNAFGYVASPENYIEPKKRPLSSITATIVTDKNGSLYLVVGAAGGSRILSSTIQNLIWVLDRNMSVTDALLQPRLHDQLLPSVTTFEWSYDNGTVKYMADLGYNTTWVPPLQSRAHAISVLQNGTFEAAVEPRLKNAGGFVL